MSSPESEVCRDNTDSDRVEIRARTRCISRKILDVLGLLDGYFFDLFSHCQFCDIDTT